MIYPSYEDISVIQQQKMISLTKKERNSQKIRDMDLIHEKKSGNTS